jgi:hypothetical protein
MPRLLVLRSRSRASVGWSFFAGAAVAASVFALGFLVGQGSPEETVRPAASIPADAEPLSARLDGIERRLAGHEQPAASESDVRAGSLTRAQLREELERLEQRFDRRRAEDLKYFLESMTAAELRTGTWMDHTQDALNYLALQQDPRIKEH